MQIQIIVYEREVPVSYTHLGMEPFITLSFMALPVIPQLRITPRGLFSVSEFCLLDTIRNGEDNGN